MIRFSSPASNHFSMMDADAQRMIELMGHTPSTRGALSAEDIGHALQRLRSATQADQALHRIPPAAKHRAATEDEEEPPVSLAQRAWPLLDMLERAQAQKKPVLWGM